MGATKGWYEVIAIGEQQAQIDNLVVRGRSEVDGALRRLQALYPSAAMIFVRQYYWRRERRTFRVLHKLTITKESMA